MNKTFKECVFILALACVFLAAILAVTHHIARGDEEDVTLTENIIGPDDDAPPPFLVEPVPTPDADVQGNE